MASTKFIEIYFYINLLFQNVLLQMGLNVVSIDGIVVHETKTWVKRCHACFKIVPDVSKEFCSKCGNQTLKRVSMTLNADGTMKIHISGLLHHRTKLPPYLQKNF